MRTPALAAALLMATALPAAAQEATAAIAGDGISGTATFTQTPSGLVHIVVEIEGVPAGPHGLHIHEIGTCDAAGGFESAGGHLANGHDHGVEAEAGPHPGDLPNVHVREDGIVHAEFFAHRLTLGEPGDGMVALADQDGAAIVLHADADDYTSQPAGGAGDRIACGVIEAARQ